MSFCAQKMLFNSVQVCNHHCKMFTKLTSGRSVYWIMTFVDDVTLWRMLRDKQVLFDNEGNWRLLVINYFCIFNAWCNASGWSHYIILYLYCIVAAKRKGGTLVMVPVDIMTIAMTTDGFASTLLELCTGCIKFIHRPAYSWSHYQMHSFCFEECTSLKMYGIRAAQNIRIAFSSAQNSGSYTLFMLGLIMLSDQIRVPYFL